MAVRTTTGFKYYLAFHLRETAGVTATLTSVNVDLSADGNVFFSTPYPDGSQITDAQGAPDYEIADNNPEHPLATRADITLTYRDANGHTGLKTQLHGDVTFKSPPVITFFQADRANLNPGETTVLRWSAAGLDAEPGSGVLLKPSSVAPAGWLPATGTLAVRPCAGNTVFTLNAVNLAGTTSGTVPVSEALTPGVVSVCGNWEGSYNETWTDSLGASGTTSNILRLVLSQWDASFTGTWLRGFGSGRGFGQYKGELSATLAGPDLTGTVTFTGNGSDPQIACPSAIVAVVSGNGAQISGSYRSKCRLQDGTERSAEGTFTVAPNPSDPYPGNFVLGSGAFASPGWK